SPRKSRPDATKHRQGCSRLIKRCHHMSVSLLFRNGALCFLASALPVLCFGQQAFLKDGGEYCVPGLLPGLQSKPQASINSAGGFLVWEDNVADGRGLG